MKAKVKASGEIINVKEWRGPSDVIYSTPDMNMFYAENELEIIPDTRKEVTIEGWVARDKNNDLSLYQTYPERQSNLGYWRDGKDEIELPKESFPSVTWQSEPKKVKITITPME